MKKNNPEAKFGKQLTDFLESKGIYHLGVEKQKMTVEPIGYYEKRWGNAFTPSGLADYHLVIKGISIEVETKAENGRPSMLQLKAIEQVIESGGIAILLFPNEFDKFKDLINEICLQPKKLDYRVISYRFGGKWLE